MTLTMLAGEFSKKLGVSGVLEASLLQKRLRDRVRDDSSSASSPDVLHTQFDRLNDRSSAADVWRSRGNLRCLQIDNRQCVWENISCVFWSRNGFDLKRYACEFSRTPQRLDRASQIKDEI